MLAIATFAAVVLLGSAAIHAAEIEAGDWSFTQLFVNGQRRFRPRLPAQGWFTIAATLPPSDAAEGKGRDRFGFSGDDLRADWAELGDVEVLALHRWTMSRMRIAEVVPPAGDSTGTVTFTGHTRAITDWCSFPQGNRYLVENVRAALGEPGSWHAT